MANEKRKKAPQFTSPKGPFRFPKLSEPDYGNTDYPKPDGEFSVQLILDLADPETQAFIAKLQPLYDEALAEAAEAFKKLKVDSRKALEKKGIKAPVENALYTEMYDKETEEPTGEIFFKFAMPMSGEFKTGPKAGERWGPRKPTIVDAKGTIMKKVPEIWGGTKGKVAFETNPYFIPGTAAAGLKLKLVGAQILELVAAGGRTAASMGFGVEDGYSHDDTPAAETTSVYDEASENPAAGLDTGNF
jgi:hypothetical protein